MSEPLLNCPFCGSDNIDPEGWASLNPETGEQREGPTCDDCDAAAASVEAWNRRSEPRGDDSPLAPEGAPQLGSAQLSSQSQTSSVPLAKHTPGPWSLRDVMFLLPNASGDPEVMANAHLIAAAPDLLEALKVAAKWITVGEAADAARAQVAAAIARAERHPLGSGALVEGRQAASEASEPRADKPVEGDHG